MPERRIEMKADQPGLDLAEHLDREERAFLEASLSSLVRDETAAKQLKEQIDPIRARLKAYHDQHPDEPIMDAERGLIANFVERGKGAAVDLIALAENSPEPANTLLGLARAGLLSCSVTGLRRLKGASPWADEALRFMNDGGTTTVLSVDRIEQ